MASAEVGACDMERERHEASKGEQEPVFDPEAQTRREASCQLAACRGVPFLALPNPEPWNLPFVPSCLRAFVPSCLRAFVPSCLRAL